MISPTKFPAEYNQEELGNPDEIYNPKYRFDSRGSLVLPITPYQRQSLKTTPGSKDVKMGMESDKDYPLNDPNTIKSGYLHVSTGIKTGKKGGWVTEMAGGDSSYPIRYYNETTGTAKFYLDNEGNVYLSGEIHADSGYIGGWLVGEHTITAQTGVCGMNSEVTAGVDWRFWSGNATPGSSNFRVDDAGKVYCADITITGGTGVANLADAGNLAVLDQVDTLQIVNAAIEEVKIATAAITEVKIDNAAITTAKIATNAITEVKINSAAISAAKIQTNAITEIKINANAVTSDKIITNAVTADKIIANAITSVKILASAITADKILASAVTADKIATNAITAIKINANAITSVKILASAITADKIIASAVTADKIATNAVTAIKINANAVTSDKIVANAVIAGKIAANAVTANEINVTNLSSIKADIGSITAGTVTGTILRTSSSGQRVTMEGQLGLLPDKIGIYKIGGNETLQIYGGASFTIFSGALDVIPVSFQGPFGYNAFNIHETYIESRDIRPLGSSEYLGSDGSRWHTLYANNICLAGVCRSTWPSVAAFSCTDLGSCNLNQLGTRAHSSLTGITTDQHHAQSHSHGSHTGIGASDHHDSLSNGYTITPSNVTTGTLYPSSHLNSDIGSSTKTWDNIYCSDLYYLTTWLLNLKPTAGPQFQNKPLGLHVRSGTPGAAGSYQGYMYYDTNQTDIVFSTGGAWYKVTASLI